MFSKINKTKKSFITAIAMSLVFLMANTFGMLLETKVGNINPPLQSETWVEHKSSKGITGNGTQNSPLLISTAEQLAYIGNISGGYVKLVADIDLGAYEWIPLDFNIGEFDGCGHTISNLNINNSRGLGDVGFFKNVSNRIIKNIKFFNVFIDGGVDGGNIGTVAGLANGSSTLFNIHIQSGTLVGRKQYDNVGGLVGQSWTDDVVEGPLIDSCTNNATIRNYMSTGSTGGIIGANKGNLVNCVNSGDVQGIDSVGGIAGATMNNSIIDRCYAECKVTGMSAIAGVVGHHAARKGIVANCGFKGTIELTYNEGAMSGAITGLISNAEDVKCENCFAIVELYYIGSGLSQEKYVSCGNYTKMTVNDCYAYTRMISMDSATVELRDYRNSNSFRDFAYHESINGGYPFPKALFAVGQFIDVDVQSYLNEFGFSAMYMSY